MLENSLQVRLEVIDQPSGQYTLSFDTSQYVVTLKPEAHIPFSEWLRRLRPVLVGYNDPAGSRDPQDLMRNVGMWLWQALLPEGAPSREREALTQALRTGRTPLVLALPDTLAELPWELLCDPDQAGERGFLARRRPLIRLIASENESTVSPITPPLRVLLLISSPLSLGEHARIDVESERSAIERATYEMRMAGRLYLRIEDIATRERVQDALITFDPHIVHYIGHGAYDERIGGVLLWEDKQGNEEHLSAADLAEILYPQNICAVVLHACETGRRNVRTDVYGIAGILVREGVPAVLAQQANFTYESSQLASKTWYTALAANRGFAQALFEVRRALAQAGRPDWAVPVLQANASSLVPLLDPNASPGSPDPLLTSVGAAADLPTPTGVFVGRQRELRALRLMLESVPGSGPVMALITGPGGVGKSTLVAQAVTRYGRDYTAALTLHCQGYQTVDLFLQRIGEFLKRLGIPSFLDHYLPDPKLSTEAKIEEAIVALNAAGPLLLVIDNLESVQNDDQTIRDGALFYLLQKLLTNLRGGRVLLTGRYAVKGLLPQGKFAANLRRLDLDDLNTYETNQLLTRHPALARLGETVRKMLIDEFGGLPYVYDLLSSDAASQSLDLLIHDMQGRITEARKQHTAKEWHEVRRQVIEFAALEAAVERLSAASHVLLAQLSVLYQPFPLAAIEDGLGAVRTVWQPLLDRSLLHYDPQEKSYHLHSLTRRYAEDLLEDDAQKQIQAQLASWYERYAMQTSHHLADALEAHRLWRAAGHVQQAGTLVMQLAGTLERFGLYPLLRDLCEQTLSDTGESDELLAASALCELGRIAQFQGKYEEARRLYQQSLAIRKQLGDQSGQADSLYNLGMIAQDQGEYEEAHGLYQQSLDLFEQLGDPRGRASSLHNLGWLAQEQGEYEEARRLYQQSLAIRERLGDQSGQEVSLHHLGWLAQNQRKYEEARKLYQQSLAIRERLGDPRGRASSLHNLGWLAQEQGEYEEARRLYQQSLAIRERLGDLVGQAMTLHNLGMIAQEQGEYEEADRLYQQSLNIFEQSGNQKWRANSLGQLGEIAQEQGEYEEAYRLYQQSLAIRERLGDPRGRADSLHNLGKMAQEQGKYKEARDFYQQSLDLLEQLGDQSGQAMALYNLGKIAQEQGEYEEARRLYQQSLAIQRPLKSQHGQVLATLFQLGKIAQDQGEYEEARGFYQQSLDLLEQLGDQSERTLVLLLLGKMAQDQGKYEEARGFYQQSLDLLEQLGDQSRRASVLHELGKIAQELGKYKEARGLYQQSLDLFEQLGDQSRQAMVLHNLGTIAQEQEEYEEAHRLYQQSLAIRERLGDQNGQAMALHNLGKIAKDQGMYEEARSLFQQSLDLSEQLEDQSGQAMALHNLGMIAQEQRMYEEAHGLYRQSLAISEQLGDQRVQANSLGQLGHLARDQGRYEEARGFYQQSLDLSKQLGDQRGQAMTLRHLGMIAQDQGEHEEAYRLYQQSLIISEQLGDQRVQANSLGQLGNLAKDQGKYEEACGLYQQSLDLSKQLGDQRGQAMTLENWGLIAQKQGKYEEAHSLYQQSLIISEQLGDQHRQAGTLHQLGIVAYLREEYEEARRLCEQSLAISEQLGDQHGRANSLGQLGLLAYEQGNLEDALIYTIQAYIIFDALGSPHRTLAQRTMSEIRSRMSEETFITHWRTFAGDRPLIAALEQTKRQITVEDLPTVVSSLALKGTAEECQQFAADLVETQQQLPPEALPLGRFLGCLAAVLRRETPEMSLLEPPFTELWQEFQERLRVLSDASSQQEEGNDG